MTEQTESSGDWVSASEVAAYVYCPESWRLGHGCGLASRHTHQRARGIAEHAAWQDVERRASRLSRLGIVLMLLALAGLLASLALRRSGLVLGW